MNEKSCSPNFKFQTILRKVKKSKATLAVHHFNRTGGKLKICITKWENLAIWHILHTSIQLVFNEFLLWVCCCTNKRGEKPFPSSQRKGSERQQ